MLGLILKKKKVQGALSQPKEYQYCVISLYQWGYSQFLLILSQHAEHCKWYLFIYLRLHTFRLLQGEGLSPGFPCAYWSTSFSSFSLVCFPLFALALFSSCLFPCPETAVLSFLTITFSFFPPSFLLSPSNPDLSTFPLLISFLNSVSSLLFFSLSPLFSSLDCCQFES